MKKITLVFFLIFTFSFLLSGCGLVEQTKALSKTMAIRNDLNNYIDVVNKLNGTLNNLRTLVEKEFTNVEDNNLALKNLKNNLIPQYEKLLQDTKNTKMKTDEVNKLHAEYINAIEFEVQNFKNFEKALETNDETLLNKANDESTEVNAKIDSHWNNLKKMCNQYKVPIVESPTKRLN